jgi:hypothetical protein
MYLADQDVHDFERQLRRSRKFRNIAIMVVIGAIVAAPFVKLFWDRHKMVVANEAYEAKVDQERRDEEAYKNRPLTAEEQARLRELAPALRRRVDDAQRAWAVATSPEALRAVSTRAEVCPADLRAPTVEAGRAYAESGSIDGNYFGNLGGIEVVQPGKRIDVPPFDSASETADAIAARVAAGTLQRQDLAAAQDLVTGDPDALFVVADEMSPPFVMGATFEPGTIKGTAYLYSFGSGRVVCAGQISVRNSAEVDIHFTALRDAPLDEQNKHDEAARGALARDLEVELARGVATGLHAVR